MRTTIDLPDELFRQAKARAALDGRKLKDLIAEYVERGLNAEGDETKIPAAGQRRRSPLPDIPKASSRGTVPALTNAEIEAILDDQDADRASRPAGP
jgi:hypothetical protein